MWHQRKIGVGGREWEDEQDQEDGGGKYAKINLFINVVMRVGNIYANIKIQIYPTLYIDYDDSQKVSTFLQW